MASLTRAATETEEARRRLLNESDTILEAVEELHLADAEVVPDRLRQAITHLQRRLGRREPPLPPATLRAAHSMVFAVQQRLMAANPRNPGTRVHAGRGAGQPLREALRAGASWKVLTLPPPPADGADESWRELLEATVERALERWAYAQHQAARAAQERAGCAAALAAARAAWSNYYELQTEAERIRLSLGDLPPAAP